MLDPNNPNAVDLQQIKLDQIAHALGSIADQEGFKLYIETLESLLESIIERFVLDRKHRHNVDINYVYGNIDILTDIINAARQLTTKDIAVATV